MSETLINFFVGLSIIVGSILWALFMVWVFNSENKVADLLRKILIFLIIAFFVIGISMLVFEAIVWIGKQSMIDLSLNSTR